MPALVVVDHPILDLVAPITEDDLTRFALDADSMQLAKPEHKALYEHIEVSASTSRVPGGSGLNSLRSAAWWVRKAQKRPPSYGFFGAVGSDAYAEILREECKRSCIVTEFQVIKDAPTAKSAILVLGKTRTMVTELGAASKTSLEAPGTFEDMFATLLGLTGNMVLTTGYLVNQNPAGAQLLQSESDGRYTLAMSLSATFVAGAPAVADFIRGCRIVFGTLAEAQAFTEANGGPQDGDAITTFIQQWPGCEDRWVIITDGPRSVRFANSDGLTRFPVEKIDTSLIVDDNGAGDAFAGAFLACHISGGSAHDCVRAGMDGAREALQNVGCNFRDPEAYETQSTSSSVLRRRLGCAIL